MTNHRLRRRRIPVRLEVGDEVVTRSGIYGFISGFGDSVVWLEIDDGVQVRIERAAIGRKVGSSVAVSSARSARGRSGPAEAAAVERRPSADSVVYTAGASSIADIQTGSGYHSY